MFSGQFYGHAYSANRGWINPGYNTVCVVKTDSIAPGVDSNGNGIADAWKLIHCGNLTTAARLYKIETSSTLLDPTWTDAGLGIFVPDSNTTTTRQVSGTNGAQFFRVRAVRLRF